MDLAIYNFLPVINYKIERNINHVLTVARGRAPVGLIVRHTIYSALRHLGTRNASVAYRIPSRPALITLTRRRDAFFRRALHVAEVCAITAKSGKARVGVGIVVRFDRILGTLSSLSTHATTNEIRNRKNDRPRQTKGGSLSPAISLRFGDCLCRRFERPRER